MTRKAPFFALFLLPILFLIPHLPDFIFLRSADFSDILISHYPNALLIQRTITESRTIPLWSPAILSGYPFVADPLSGLHYPPGWLALIFPLPSGFNLVIIMHLLFGGVGMFLFLKAEGLSPVASLFGGLLFEAMPKVFAHLGAGHLTLLYAVSWTPWLLYAERRSHHSLKRWVLPGAVLGMIALADLRWAAYAGLLYLGYSLWNWLKKDAGAWDRGDFRNRRPVSWALSRVTNGIFALLIAAPLLLPLMEYTALSTRSSLTAKDNQVFSLPPGQLLGLAYPNIGGGAEWTLYPGAAVVVLALLALAIPQARRNAGFWLGAIPVTILMSMGSNVPFLQFLYRFPGFDLLRVPSRALFLTGFCLAASAAHGLDSLYQKEHGQRPARKDYSAVVLFAVAAFVVFLGVAAAVVVTQPVAKIQFAWGAVFFFIVTLIVLLQQRQHFAGNTWLVLLVSVGLCDLCGVNGLSLEGRSSDQVFQDGSAAAQYIAIHAGHEPYRVYSPSYSIPQQVAARYGLQLADGVDPLQLTAYSSYMEKTTNVPSQGYSVTLPAFANGDPSADNRGYTPDPARLGLLNVRYVAAAFPLVNAGLRLLTRYEHTWIYENSLAAPRVWVQLESSPPGKDIISQPRVMYYPNAVLLNAVGPGLLVLSEIAYPGWHATIDGKSAEVVTPGGLLRGVVLPAGQHVLRFDYQPARFYFGIAVACLAWVSLIFILWRTRHG